MDAQAKKKALYRARLKAQNQDKRIDSPLVRYNESDQPVCKVCDIVLKSESAWSAHQISAKHREAIKNVRANAAAASRVNNVKPVPPTDSDKPKPERSGEAYKGQMGPPQPQSKSKSALPSNFFDKPETKRQEKESTTTKLMVNDKKKKVVDSRENKRVEISSPIVSETIGDETPAASQTRALPEGFFDDKDADLRARGITPVKLDIKDEYKEFEKLIQEDLKEIDNRMEEEEYDAAETIEEEETVEQKSCRERVEIFKRKKMELKAARSAKHSKVAQVVKKENSSDESSSDEDSDDAVDWRAKHL
ncbi:protein ABA AND ROS SENSITIVE 1 [Rutidosis leptorrhynchoides]|uniref:protein ABA AND ROS SENSITIVE 1 n=1 Tax=Rutidosis leptorrhynchoides TaxID=125765 RepID=UPI003A990B72